MLESAPSQELKGQSNRKNKGIKTNTPVASKCIGSDWASQISITTSVNKTESAAVFAR
jgi:hypothetical protein